MGVSSSFEIDDIGWKSMFDLTTKTLNGNEIKRILYHLIRKSGLNFKHFTHPSKIIVKYCGNNLKISIKKKVGKFQPNQQNLSSLQSKQLKLAILGSCGVGKTALANRLISDKFEDSWDHTIEDSYRKKLTVDTFPVLLDILDTSGHKKHSSLRQQWIKEVNAVIFMYSVCNQTDFAVIQNVFDEILKVRNVINFDTFPLVLVGNKIDKERKVSTEKGEEFGKKYNIPFTETSVKEKINIKKVFDQIVREYRKKCLEWNYIYRN